MTKFEWVPLMAEVHHRPIEGRVGFGVEEDSCIVRVELREGFTVEKTASDFFKALGAVRAEIEPQGYRLICNGSRIDVYPSGMQRQMSLARFAYVMTMPRRLGAPPTVDIFAAAPLASQIATVAEQLAFAQAWRNSSIGDHGG